MTPQNYKGLVLAISASQLIALLMMQAVRWLDTNRKTLAKNRK